MTFNPKKTADVRMIHYKLSADATVNDDGKIIFNSKTESSTGTNVSFDGSGNLTLDEMCSYYMILTPDVVRSSLNDRLIDISMFNSGGTKLDPSTGATSIRFFASTSSFSNLSLIATLKNPTDTYYFKFNNISNSNSATFKAATNLMIMEFY